jgi:single-strand DNA-binding protein
MNRVFLIGNAGRDAEVRRSAKGDAWCSFSIATNRRVRGPDGEWTEEADWHEIRAFGRTAEACARYVAKGRAVAVEGSLSYSKWKDDQGNPRVSTRILADRVEFLDTREARPPSPTSSPSPQPAVEPSFEQAPDDLPF